MPRMIVRPWIWMMLLSMFCLTTLAVASDGSQTATGCLQQGKETGGYYLVTNDNQHLELYSSSGVDLSKYVGQTVTVTGGPANRTEAQEHKSQPYEKEETGTMKHADLQVSSVKSVSSTCK